MIKNKNLKNKKFEEIIAVNKKPIITMNNLALIPLLLIIILSINFVSAASYSENTLNIVTPEGTTIFTSGFDRSQCQAGQDFVLQIDPTGCVPSVVRSDLLEQQNVPVFCPVIATQLNPLIDVDAINQVSITGQYPKEVSGSGYYPAKAALGKSGLNLIRSVGNTIGYAVIVLKKNVNEASMPNFVEGNLTARIKYDVKNAFGVGQATYYLPQLTEENWNQNYKLYSFWDGRGYLKLESTTDNSASISIYSDRETYSSSKIADKRKITTVNLNNGQISGEIPMPGFDYCLGSLQLQLKGIQNPDTISRLNINGDYEEFTKGEQFLNNKCSVKDVTKQGIVEKTTIRCSEDEKTSEFSLITSPKIKLEIDGGIKDYSIGDKLYEHITTEKTKTVWLAYIKSKDGSKNQESLVAKIVEIPGVDANKDKLTPEEINAFANYYNDLGDLTLTSIIQSVAEASFNVLKKMFVGAVYKEFDRDIFYGDEPKDIFGKNVKLIGYADAVDADLSTNAYPSDFKDYYEKAMSDYDSVLNSFSNEKYPLTDIKTLGQYALENKIELASNANQMRTVTDLCKEFKEKYLDLDFPKICSSADKLASSEINFMDVTIEGKVYQISPDGVREPEFEEYGAKILINIPGTGIIPAELKKNQIFMIDSSTGEYIQLVDIPNINSVKLNVIHLKAAGTQAGIEQFLGSKIQPLEKGTPDNFQSNYTFTLEEVNLKKVAKVSVKPKINYENTNATFSFKIGIEKRAIQLSPEKTQERINSLEKTIKQWNSINSKLGNVVSGLKAACLVTGTTLVIKNFIANVGGEGLARQKVMSSPGGWYEICKKEAAAGKYDSSVDKCLLDNSAQIEKAIDEYSTLMSAQNEQLKKLQEGATETSFFEEDVVDTAKVKELYINDAYRNELQQNLDAVKITSVTLPSGEVVQISKIMSAITPTIMSLTDARDLQLNARLLDSSDATVRDIASKKVNSLLQNIYLNSKAEIGKQEFVSSLSDGFSNLGYSVLSGKDTQTAYYSGGTTTKQIGEIPSGIPSGAAVQGILYNQVEYIVQLEKVGTENYKIVGIYDKAGKKISDENIIKAITERYSFKYYDRTTFVNSYTQPYPKLKYYETGNYKGVPAIVPFDSKEGWYAAIEPVIPIGGAVKSVSDSGVVTSYYLCNVGKDGQENFNSGIGDDICMGINRATGQLNNLYPGLDKDKAAALVNKANSAIAEASSKYPLKAGDKIGLFGEKFDIGEPATGTPGIQCQDFMSATECNILFNICDPVVCPSSRCNLGGNYPVSNVIQSGVIGSLALCLPNFPEIKVPICLSGVHAGLEGYITVLDSYKKCLQTSLDTGATVGICDELNSIYMCDFFWRQSLPLVQYAVPKIIGSVLGQNTKGGGEYLGFQDAWSKVGDSVDYFTQYYAENSFAAFKARSFESVGTAVCKNWVSITAPNSGSVFDALVSPDSPSQFYGSFDEIPYTTATTTPMSQYKVFYHIYAGTDLPAYYQVYLKGTSSSYYQDTSYRKIVANNFIKAGDYATATEDFLAPSGYNQMCIVVNNQEECGFKQISTDFAVNYLKDQYVASQANQTDITTETACISGTASLYSILNANLQAGAEDVVNPALYNSGITRVCATDNPGIGTDTLVGTANARWKEVGYCGNTKIKCWLDTQSVKDAIKMTNIENEVLGAVSDNYLAILQKEGGYVTDFKGLVEQIDKEPNYLKKIDMITTNFNKVFFNSEKGYLYLLRANAFRNLTEGILKVFRDDKNKKEASKTYCVKSVTTGEKFKVSDVLLLEDSELNLWCSQHGGTALCENDESGVFTTLKVSAMFECSKTAAPIKPVTLKTPTTTITPTTALLPINVRIVAYTMFGDNFLGDALSLDPIYIWDGKNWKDGGNTMGLFPIKNAKSTGWIDGINFISERVLGLEASNAFSSVELSCGDKKATLVTKYSLFSVSVVDAIKAKAKELCGYISSETTPISLTCSTTKECQKVLGQKIMEIAKEMHKKKSTDVNGDNDLVKEQTGVANFECLVLLVANKESSLKHCKEYQQNNNPLYCNGNLNEIVKSTATGEPSYGIMQINTDYHPGVDVANFEANVKEGVNYLLNKYGPSKSYSCYRQTDGNFVNVIYAGWQRSLRIYNGWNEPPCTNTGNYVTDVLSDSNINVVTSLFPECKTTATSATTAEIETEVCINPAPEVFSSAVTSLGDANERVVSAAEELEGKPAAGANCFVPIDTVYKSAGVGFSCVYPDEIGKKYIINEDGTSITVTIGIDKNNYGEIIYSVPSTRASCSTKDTLSYEQKLNNLLPGDQLDIVWSSNYAHAVIFMGWENKATKTAKIFDWLGGTKGARQYEIYTLSLAENEHPVYLHRRPILI